ncbi:hypothetical protein CsSME_00036627 [Camellia sinensis var. sinensis]
MKFVTPALMGFVTPTLMGFVTPAFIAEVNESASAVAGFDRRILGDRRRDSSSTRPTHSIVCFVPRAQQKSYGNLWTKSIRLRMPGQRNLWLAGSLILKW